MNRFMHNTAQHRLMVQHSDTNWTNTTSFTKSLIRRWFADGQTIPLAPRRRASRITRRRQNAVRNLAGNQDGVLFSGTQKRTHTTPARSIAGGELFACKAGSGGLADSDRPANCHVYGRRVVRRDRETASIGLLTVSHTVHHHHHHHHHTRVQVGRKCDQPVIVTLGSLLFVVCSVR